MAGRRPEQARHGRHLAGALRLREQIGWGAAIVLAAGPEPRTLEEHHERNLVAQREFGQPVTLGVSARSDAARQGREVLGAYHHR